MTPKNCMRCRRAFGPTGRNQRYCSNCKVDAGREGRATWYKRNRERVLAKAKSHYVKNREGKLAYARRYRSGHPETWRNWVAANRGQIAERKRLYRTNNPLHIAESERRHRDAQRTGLYRRVSGELLQICREDPRKAVGVGSIAGFSGAICLECGELHPTLSAHIARGHRTPTSEYRRKWGYAKNTGLASANFRRDRAKAARRRVMRIPPTPPPLVRGSGPAARRAWGVAKETRLNLRDRYLGRGFGASARRQNRRAAVGRPSDSVPPKRRGKGRTRTRDQQAAMAAEMHADSPKLSWAQIARKVDPVGFSKNQVASSDQIRLAVAYRTKRKPAKQ
jgi:hypothetical protein